MAKTKETKKKTSSASSDESVLAPVARDLEKAVEQVGGDVARGQAEQALTLLQQAVKNDS